MFKQLLAWGNDLGWVANLLQVGGTGLAAWLGARAWYKRTFAAEQQVMQLMQQNARQENDELRNALEEQRRKIDRLQQDSLEHIVKAAEKERNDNNKGREANLLMDWWKGNSAPLAQVAGRLGELHAEHLELAALRQAVPFLTVAAALNGSNRHWRNLLTEAHEALALSNDTKEEAFDIVAQDRTFLSDDEFQGLLSAYDRECVRLRKNGHYERACKISGRALDLAQRRATSSKIEFVPLARFRLAECLMFLGENEKGYQLAESAWREMVSLFSEHHPQTLTVAYLVAHALELMGRNEEALSLAENTWQSMKSNLPQNHPNTLACLNIKAKILSNLGRFGEALSIAELCWSARKSSLPQNDALVFESAHLFASILARQGRAGEALSIAEDCWHAERRIWPKDHPSVLASANLVARILYDLNRSSEALPIAEECWRTHKLSLGEVHPYTVANASLLASIRKELSSKSARKGSRSRF